MISSLRRVPDIPKIVWAEMRFKSSRRVERFMKLPLFWVALISKIVRTILFSHSQYSIRFQYTRLACSNVLKALLLQVWYHKAYFALFLLFPACGFQLHHVFENSLQAHVWSNPINLAQRDPGVQTHIRIFLCIFTTRLSTDKYQLCWTSQNFFFKIFCYFRYWKPFFIQASYVKQEQNP